MRRQFVSVPLHDPGGNADKFRVSAIVEEQVIAEVGTIAKAKSAMSARRRIGSHHPLPDGKLSDIRPNRNNIPGKFVAEDSRRDNHSSVVAPPEDLNICAARQSDANAHQKVAPSDLRNGDRLYAEAFPPVEYRRHHVFLHSVHLWGCTMTFNDSTVGCSAR
jgi:hypothetical protein